MFTSDSCEIHIHPYHAETYKEKDGVASRESTVLGMFRGKEEIKVCCGSIVVLVGAPYSHFDVCLITITPSKSYDNVNSVTPLWVIIHACVCTLGYSDPN